MRYIVIFGLKAGLPHLNVLFATRWNIIYSSIGCRFAFYRLAQIIPMTHSSVNSSVNDLFPEDLKVLRDLSKSSHEVL